MGEQGSSAALSAVVADVRRSPSLRFLKERIDRLDASADTKSLLLDIAELTLTVGGKILAIGRKILAVALELAEKFQNVIFGVIIALVLSAVLAAIPLLGPAISALLTPIMVAFGILKGSLEDFRNMALQAEINTLKHRMSILSAQSAE